MPATNTFEVSKFRIVLQEPSTKAFGSLIPESALLQLLEQYGSVWAMHLSPASAHITFRQHEAVTRLVASKTLIVNGIKIAVKELIWHANTQVHFSATIVEAYQRRRRVATCAILAHSHSALRTADTVRLVSVARRLRASHAHVCCLCMCFWRVFFEAQSEHDEEKLSQLFSKTTLAGSSGKMKVTEARDPAKAVAPGVDFEWRVTLTNGSTQPRELLSIEMPHQARQMFTLLGRKPSEAKPIRLLPGGTHTQQIKFNNRHGAVQQGQFSHTLLFNFSNW